MNLLDTASLVVTPNGYKASKLYSIVPSDGTGDMTFARTGDTATRVNSSGLIESVLANKPRLDYLGSTCPKLLLEPQRTNVCLQSQDISSATWTKVNSPTIVSNSAVAPDGTTTADSLQDTTGGATRKAISQAISVSANSTNTFSFYVKKETTKTFFGGVGFNFTGGTLKFAYVIFDEVNGTLTNSTGASNLTPVNSVQDLGGYWKFIITITDTGSNTALALDIFALFSTNGTTPGFGIGSVRTIWGMQLEAGAYATSYIPTTTASVTRNADSCITGSVTSLVGQTEGTIFVEISRKSIFENFFLILSSIAGTTSNSYQNSIYFLQQSNGALLIEGFVSNVKVFGFSAGILSLTSHKIAIGYKLNDFVLYIDGVQIATDTSGTVPAMNYFTLAGGADGGSNSSNIKSAALWKTRLQNAELATLTSI